MPGELVPAAMNEPDFSDAYRRWAEGRCPCCGNPLGEIYDCEDKVIGEGVVMCGDCVRRGHADPDGDEDCFIQELLLSIAAGARAARS